MTVHAKCQAAIMVGVNKPIEIWELPVPDPEPGAILVKTEAATICATEVHIWEGRLTRYLNFPLVAGHEMTGRIARLGKGVTHDVADRPIREGDRIVWSQAWCGNCFYCSVANQPTLCSHVASMYGFGPADKFPGLTGGLAEYVYVRPESKVVKVPEKLDPAVVSSATCALRTVVHAYDRFGGLGIQESVVILGCGSVGLYALAMAINTGAAKTIVIGAPKDRLDVAAAWGANHTIDVGEVTDVEARREMVWQWTEGRGPDVVIECAGPSPAFEDGFKLCRDGARYLVIGQTDPWESSISASRINLRQVSVMGSFSATGRHYFKAMEFLKNTQHRFDFQQLISKRFSLNQAEVAIRALAEKTEIKPAVVF